ncbi:glycosyltransferase family 2 protein [Patulibacter minatonensis]|uniref:glycosyltransferase family 2 protein n=1 Tax=Patulibacter minatonensis TaxID=298163 RepID=UPI000684C11E|nr:glycosyltransferase family 2 protein [Patulibacter minatonensis]
MATTAHHPAGADPQPIVPLDPAVGVRARRLVRPADAHAPLLRSVTIVLPCFDEAENVAAAIAAAKRAGAMSAVDYEVVVVDDGSTDATCAIAGAIVSDDPHVRLIVHTRNRGYGDAVRSGIEAARMDWVLLTDADLQFDLDELRDLVPLTADGDVVWGWRIDRRDSARRRAAAAVWNGVVRTLFALPVRDVDCAFKLIRRDLLRDVHLVSSGAMISTELLVRCRAAGARVVEAGVHHHPRVAGEESGGDPRVILRALRELASTYPALRALRVRSV